MTKHLPNATTNTQAYRVGSTTSITYMPPGSTEITWKDNDRSRALHHLMVHTTKIFSHLNPQVEGLVTTVKTRYNKTTSI